MLVLSGKKIRLVVFSTFAVFLLLALSVNLTNEKSKYIETVALPVSGKVVVVDAGHGIPDEGNTYCIKQKILSNYSFIKNKCRCKSLRFF